jgi:hypothetical protein
MLAARRSPRKQCQQRQPLNRWREHGASGTNIFTGEDSRYLGVLEPQIKPLDPSKEKRSWVVFVWSRARGRCYDGALIGRPIWRPQGWSCCCVRRRAAGWLEHLRWAAAGHLHARGVLRRRWTSSIWTGTQSWRRFAGRCRGSSNSIGLFCLYIRSLLTLAVAGSECRRGQERGHGHVEHHHHGQWRSLPGTL